MASGILGISLSGLYAAQAGIRTTQHNIANVNTTGYRRQEVVQGPQTPEYTGGGYLGRGVALETVRRAYDRFLDNEVLLNQTQLARHEVYAGYASQVDRIMGDAGSGLASGLERFFSGVDAVVNDPASVVARQSMLSAGQGLAVRINGVDERLREMLGDTDSDIRTLVDEINKYASQLTQVNAAIARLEGVQGDQANDLRDQRDQLVSQINKLANVNVVEQADGTFNLFVGSGQALVVGEKAYALAAIPDPQDAERTVAALTLSPGNNLVLDRNLVTGGRLSGLLNLREDVLKPALDEVNQLAVSLAVAVNAIHRAGFDQNGVTGVNFFADPVAADAGNAGTGVVGLSHLGLRQEIASDYTLTFNGAPANDYTLTRLADGATRTGSLAQVVDLDADGDNDVGFDLSVAGAPVAGDFWNLELRNYARDMAVVPTTGAGIAAASAAGEPGNNVQALQMAALRTQALMNGGTDHLNGYYAGTVGRTAVAASEADLSVASYSVLVEQTEAAQQNLSGVNLDEEAANLIRYQQAYQAAARAIQIASSLFDEILSAVR